MADKQIIIDVTQCPYYKEDNTCTYLPHNSKCEGDCNWTTYKELEARLLHKEQECEKLKEDLIEAKAHGDYLNNLALSETLNLVSEQLDQLKADNEQLKFELQTERKDNKYIKDWCIEAGKELAKHSFDWDGKEKNLVIQAMELNEKFETKEQECEALKEENNELKISIKDLSYENQKFCYQIEELTKQLKVK